MFRPAKQNRIFQDVVNQIQDSILSGTLKTGDVLPPERELRRMFMVSRGTIREALRVLEQKGLIEIRLGVDGGAVVKDVSTDKVTESLALMIRSQKVPLEHLAEFREDIEGNISALAAQRATGKDIEKLEHLLEKALECINKGAKFVREFLEVDMDFHLTLSQISGNPIYESVERVVQGNIIPYYDTFLDMEDRKLKENYDDLCKITEAVRHRRPEEARSLARKHVAKFSKYMEKRKVRNDVKEN